MKNKKTKIKNLETVCDEEDTSMSEEGDYKGLDKVSKDIPTKKRTIQSLNAMETRLQQLEAELENSSSDSSKSDESDDESSSTFGNLTDNDKSSKYSISEDIDADNVSNPRPVLMLSKLLKEEDRIAPLPKECLPIPVYGNKYSMDEIFNFNSMETKRVNNIPSVAKGDIVRHSGNLKDMTEEIKIKPKSEKEPKRKKREEKLSGETKRKVNKKTKMSKYQKNISRYITEYGTTKSSIFDYDEIDSDNTNDSSEDGGCEEERKRDHKKRKIKHQPEDFENVEKSNLKEIQDSDGLDKTVQELLASYVPASHEKKAFYCRVCQVQCEDLEAFQLHKQTPEHIYIAEKERKKSYCKLCRKQFTSIIQLQNHIKGKGHKDLLEKRMKSSQQLKKMR